MFIVWGTRYPRTPIGRVADFCHACNDVRGFRVQEVRRVSHIYFIPLGRGAFMGHTKVCEACAGETDVDLQRYARVDNDPARPIEALTTITNPGLNQEMVERYDLEDRARAGKLAPRERVPVIIQALIPASQAVERRGATFHVDWQTGLAFAGVFIVPVIALSVLMTINPRASDSAALKAVLISGGAMFALMVYLAATDVSRYIRRKQLRGIATALMPFNPSEEEIEEVLAEYRSAGQKLGRKLKPRQILEAIELEHAREGGAPAPGPAREPASR